MSYIKFINDDTEYQASIMPFKTQHGIDGIRIVAEDLPVNESGFIYYSDKDEVIGDYHIYRYHYEGNSYSVAKDIIEYGGGSNAPLPTNPLSRIENHVANLNVYMNNVANGLNNVSEEVKELTPYTETKTAYIDDTEIIFETDLQGIISVSAINRNKETVPVEFTRNQNKIIVSFEPLESVTEVTINIQ